MSPSSAWVAGNSKELPSACQSTILQPNEQLANQVRHPSRGRSSTETRDPFAMNGAIDEGHQPQPGEMRVTADEMPQGFMGNEYYRAGTDGDDAVFHHL